MPNRNKKDDNSTRRKYASGIRLKRILRRVRNLRIFFILKVLILAFLYLQKWKFPDFPAWIGVSQSIFDALLFFVTGNVATDLARQLLILFYVRKHKLTGSVQNSFILGIGRFATLISVILLAFSGLILFEINTLELFASISIVAAGLAILLKDYITTMVNGMILMFANHISLDDYVKIGEHKGRVVDITLLDLILRTDTEETVLIPNNTAMLSPIVNYTLRPVKLIHIDFEVALPCPFEIEAFTHFLIDSISEYRESLDERKYELRITDLKRKSLNMQFIYVFKAPDREIERQIEKIVIRGVLEYMNMCEKKPA